MRCMPRWKRRRESRRTVHISLACCGTRIRPWPRSTPRTTASPTILVLTQSLHGLTFGFWWLGGIAHVLRMAPEGLRSTAQAAFVASGFGLGNLIALGIASYALPTWGSARLFTGLTVVSMLAALLLPWALSRRSSGSSARP